MQPVAADPAIRQAHGGQRMRRDHRNALARVQPRRVGIDQERRDALGARRLAAAREDDVAVGHAAVGDPGLHAVEHPAVAVAPRGGGHRRHVGAGVGLRQGERRDQLAAGHARQQRLLLRRRCRTG